jgi:hypothetical protein
MDHVDAIRAAWGFDPPTTADEERQRLSWKY